MGGREGKEGEGAGREILRGRRDTAAPRGVKAVSFECDFCIVGRDKVIGRRSQAGDLIEADERVGEGRRKSMAAVQCAHRVNFFVILCGPVSYGFGRIFCGISPFYLQGKKNLYYGIMWFHMEQFQIDIY